MKERILTGDIVNVHFVRGMSLFRYKVLSDPASVIDSWILEKDGDLQYVQQFESMQLAPIEAS